MIKLDLITGFLGAGKSTFITEYVHYLKERGEEVAVIVNDHGAINVDRLFLEETIGDICHIEMVIGGDVDCHKRRLKTKLISLALGMGDSIDGVETPVGKFDRVILEPSGVFDSDEFFNLIYEPPLTKWYEVGNCIDIVDACMETELSGESRYMIASQAANAGMLLLSRAEKLPDPEQAKRRMLDFVNGCLEEFRCDRRLSEACLWKHKKTTPEEFKRIAACGYCGGDLIHLPVAEGKHFSSEFFFHAYLPEEEIASQIKRLMADPACGNLIRLKGFQKNSAGQWLEVNATKKQISVKPVSTGQEVYIMIGEGLSADNIKAYFKEEPL